MKIFKNFLLFILVFILLLHPLQNTTYSIPNQSTKKIIKIGVFLIDLTNPFNSDLKAEIEALQNEKEDEVQIIVYDGKANQSTQNDDISKALNSNIDIFVVSPISSNADEFVHILNSIANENHPLIILFPTTASLTKIINSYPSSVMISGDNEQGGTLQAKILADQWNSNKNAFDKNNDNIIQYVMLKGPSNNLLTLGRSKYSILGLNDLSIKTEELFSTFCNWQRECAKTAIESQILTLDGKIEAIISNNDSMAIGAVEALQKYGFNKGSSSKYIPVVGIGGVSEAKKLIDQGFMTGTAVQDSKIYARTIYDVAMNLYSGNKPTHGTIYNLDETGTTIKIPYYQYFSGKN